MKKFENLNLSNDLLKAIKGLGFKTTTPIQAQAIPEVMNGHDVVGLASTGTGKTAAFGLPAIEKIDPNNKNVQVIVLCPTRELAMQVASEMNKFLKFKRKISALAIYGGQPIGKQIGALRRGAQVVIGTPGRTLDHLERRTLSLRHVKMVVLDEADEMLKMGFRQDIEAILNKTPDQKQTTLFSATMSPEILKLTKVYQNDPKVIKVAQKKVSAPTVKQLFFKVDMADKKQAFVHLLNEYQPELSIVFCNTRRKVDKVAKNLKNKGYLVEGIHGDIKQTKRDRIMSKFRKRKINILVATDVAARGIDVSNVEMVVNYEIPRDVESYVHRIGRTGRAGKTGRALSLVSRPEFRRLKDIQRYTKTDIPVQDLFLKTENVSKKDAVERQVSLKSKPFCKKMEKRVNKILSSVRKSMDYDEMPEYNRIMDKFVDNKRMLKGVAAALLKMVVEVE